MEKTGPRPTEKGPPRSHCRVFGPVPSRRLGLSLGIDLIPPKTCTYDCLYCEAGRTTHKTVSRSCFFDPCEIETELKDHLARGLPDVITLAGSGEPTLSIHLSEIIEIIRSMTHVPVVILTNGSLFWKEDVLRRCLGADIIMPTFSSIFSDTFEKIHRPHGDISIEKVIKGLKTLRSAYSGRIYLELMILKGINDSKEEVEAAAEAVHGLRPDKIHLNTVVRPPSEPCAAAVEPERLEEIRRLLGPKAEIAAGFSSVPRAALITAQRLLETLARRPLTRKDICRVMGISEQETDLLVEGLRRKGALAERGFNGELYLTSNNVPELSDG